MFNIVPNDMGEVAQKLSFLQANGQENMTEQDVLVDTAKEGLQEMLDEALEGPYFNVKWRTKDQELLVTGALSEEIGTVIPRDGFDTFSADFKNNAILFWRNYGKQLTALINQE
ncbi:hypothetical protein GNF18_07050 [Ligilactobacillus pobuzihii]|uniref:hypothetical protein n=1 Tax=Ligilactobacillus pobuzihii TaxID=449659 RepID=UPI0019D0AF93|nr:hypothetical protein [Ligilactobacillus pobuzihii]MBN7274891.1 hypothetical protein [Ligilactobacillus pobuzihii]